MSLKLIVGFEPNLIKSFVTILLGRISFVDVIHPFVVEILVGVINVVMMV